MCQLSLKLFQYLLLQIGKKLIRQNSRPWCVLLVDGTGSGFQDRYALFLPRGETLCQVRAYVCLVILALVDERQWSFLLGAAVSPPYALEIYLLGRFWRI